MILTNHAIVGAALAGLTPQQPLTGFAIGFLSHFLLDAIPHWDYELHSRKRDENNPINDDIVLGKAFVKDILKVGLDGTVGLLLSLFLFAYFLHYSLIDVLAGAIGAMLPDALQFVYMKWRHEPLVSLQRFHLWIHADEIKSK